MPADLEPALFRRQEEEPCQQQPDAGALPSTAPGTPPVPRRRRYVSSPDVRGTPTYLSTDEDEDQSGAAFLVSPVSPERCAVVATSAEQRRRFLLATLTSPANTRQQRRRRPDRALLSGGVVPLESLGKLASPMVSPCCSLTVSLAPFTGRRGDGCCRRTGPTGRLCQSRQPLAAVSLPASARAWRHCLGIGSRDAYPPAAGVGHTTVLASASPACPQHQPVPGGSDRLPDRPRRGGLERLGNGHWQGTRQRYRGRRARRRTRRQCPSGIRSCSGSLAAPAARRLPLQRWGRHHTTFDISDQLPSAGNGGIVGKLRAARGAWLGPGPRRCNR